MADTITPSWSAAIDTWTRWLRTAGRPDTTIKTRSYHLRRLAGAFPTRDPGSLTTADLIEWTGSQVWATETRRSYRSSLAIFYRWAVLAGIATESPAEHLPVVRPAAPQPRPAPDDVYRAALSAAPPRTRLILRFAAEMGMRRAEIAVIHRDDLLSSVDGYSLIVHGKGAKDRVVPMTPGLATAVRECSGYLFPGLDDGHLSPRYVGKLATRALPGRWTIHSLRHRFASKVYEIDHDLFSVQDLLGHSSPVTTRHYVAPADAAKRRLVLAAAA